MRTCPICNFGFTPSDWEDRHSPDSTGEDVHAACCPDCTPEAEAVQASLFDPPPAIPPGSTVWLPPAEHSCPTCGREMGDLDAPAPVGSSHPETSRAVASLKFGSQRWRVLELLADHPEGLTACAVGAGIGLSPNQAATRLGELRSGGWVQYLTDDVGAHLKRLTARGNQALVQGVTLAGLAGLEKKS
jgi:hypothetical protein